VDGDAAALDGLDADAVTRQVDAYLAGIVATQVPEAAEDSRRPRLAAA